MNIKYDTNNQSNILHDVTNKFINNFVDNEKFMNKRFDRYVNKTKESILGYCKTVYAHFFVKQDDKFQISNLNDFTIAFFQTIYSEDILENKKEHDFKTILDTINIYAVPALEYNIDNGEFMASILLEPDKTLYDTIDTEICATCKDFIKIKSIRDMSINENNYFLTIPEQPQDILEFLHILFNRVYIDLERILKSEVTSAFLSTVNDEVVKELDNSLLEEQEKNQEYEVKIKELEQQVIQLKDQLSKTDNIIKDSLKESTEHKLTLIRQNEKLKNKYNTLLNKYKNLKYEENDIVEIEEEEYKEVDLDAKYLFVLSEDATFKNVISKTFKNATFASDNSVINPSKVDMVIVITTHISHSIYYGVKKQCKNKNIPLLHCEFSNIELIKDIIWNYINL